MEAGNDDALNSCFIVPAAGEEAGMSRQFIMMVMSSVRGFQHSAHPIIPSLERGMLCFNGYGRFSARDHLLA